MEEKRMEEKRYEIGGKTYVQRPLVLGQWRQLNDVTKEVILPKDLNVKNLIMAFGNRLFHVLAVIITEEGKSPRDKDLAALAEEIEFGVTPETALEMIADFFALNPVFSLLNNLESLVSQIQRAVGEIGLTNYASSAAAGTSPEGTGSSGASPLPKDETGPPAQ